MIVLFVAVTLVDNSLAEVGNQAIPITASQVVRDTVIITEESMGWIEAKINPIVAAEVSGRIEAIHVDTGRILKAGALMATIDSEQQRLEKVALRAEVNRLHVLVNNQERTVKRFQNLLVKKSISQEQYDNAQTRLAAFKEQLEGAMARLDDNKRRMAKASVFAPVSGWIEKRFVSKGEFVKLGKPLFHIVTDQYLRIVLPFPENTASRLNIGQPVKLTSPLTPGRIVESQISLIKPAVNIHNRAIEVIIYLENPGAWRPGSTINGTVIIDRHENSLLVPAQAIVRRPAGEVVYQIENNIARQKPVVTGQHQGKLVEILSGLTGNERVVVNGAGFLTDGATVKEMNK